jgi:cytochrome P450
MSGANKLVWRETLQQTKRLSKSWSSAEPRDLHMDVNSLTLAVISFAGFGKEIIWTGDAAERKETIPKGYNMTFLKAISDTTGYMIAILLVPGWLLKLTPLRKAGVAHSQLDKYLREMIQTEKKRIAKNENDESSIAKGNLLAEVLKASASNNLSNDNSIRPGERKDAFTEDEVMGNLFIYLLAGMLSW